MVSVCNKEVCWCCYQHYHTCLLLY